MCFDNDADWYARVVEQTTHMRPTQVTCLECHRKIRGFQPIHYTFLQEHEECQRCFDDDGDWDEGWDEGCNCPPTGKLDVFGDPIKDCCQCPEPDYGETYHYWCCQDCHRFLEAIQEAEVEEGCHPDESRPRLEEMTEALSNGGAQGAKKYYQKAAAMFPDLVQNGYLRWLWRKLFSDRY